MKQGFFDTFRPSRRLVLGAGLALAACRPKRLSPEEVAAQLRYQIDQLVAGGEVPAAGLLVRKGGTTRFEHASGFAGGLETGALRTFSSGTKFRAASISKLATALTAHRLAAKGAFSLDADVGTWIESGLKHPAFPDVPVTLAHLLSHTGGLEDPEVYWIAAPGKIESLFTDTMWRQAVYGPPGKGFRYSNFGYGLVATCLERATGKRFCDLAREEVLAPLNLSAGFNWYEVPLAERQKGATPYSKTSGVWQAATDADAALNATAPTVLLEDGFALEQYEIGSNGTLFSPQGGLRASLSDLTVLARAIATDANAARGVWAVDAAAKNGDTEGGYFTAYGTGPQIYEANDSPLSGLKLIGHHGEAYGLYAGAWHVPELDAEFAYVVTGSPEGEAEASALHPCANIYTAPLWLAAAQALQL